MKLYIKNMVSNRCKIIVSNELRKLGLHCMGIELGKADIRENISPEKRDKLNIALKKTGLELLEDDESILVEKLRNEIVAMIYGAEELPSISVSAYLSKKLNYSYTYLARLFSEKRGTTLKHYFIAQKIERAKELITYGVSLSEIAFRLHYSSTSHLSSQFKKITGLTPSNFKKAKDKKRIPVGMI
jgi:AraC-like DNA-binding protein